MTLSLSTASYTSFRGKRVPVYFLLSNRAKLTLTVRRGKWVVARLSTAWRTAGPVGLTWNDKIKGKPAPRGTYKIMMRAVSPAGATAHDAATLHIT